MASIERAAWPRGGPQPPAGPDAAARAALDGSIRAVLDDRGLLAFSGNDAVSFLHGQLSSDVRGLAAGESQLTSYSDARGRVLAVARLYREADRLLLELPAQGLEPLRRQLERYVLRAHVDITDVSADIARVGVAGESAAVVLAGVSGDLSEGDAADRCVGSGIRVVRVPGPRPRWQVLGPPEAVQSLWETLGTQIPAFGARAWRLMEIEAGIPTVRAGARGRFVAQMLNLDRLGAVDFAKGCYPGQEVIARTRNLGRIKRRMQLLRARAADGPPAPGTTVHAGGADAGEVVDAEAHPDGGTLLLAVLRLDVTGELRVGGPEGAGAERLGLPYALDDEAA